MSDQRLHSFDSASVHRVVLLAFLTRQETMAPPPARRGGPPQGDNL
jgi:hypothetical protein